MKLKEALEYLKMGGCIGLPTETVYGLAADIFQPRAIDQIFQLKKRPFFDPLIVHVSQLQQLDQVVSEFPPLAKKLVEKFWPGPLTLVLPKHKSLNSKITSGLETVGVRMPNHPLALQLIEELTHPLAAPSANLFGQTSPTQAQHVIDAFSGQVPVLDGGPCEVGVESTVIGFNANYSAIYIYRPGAVTAEMLREFAPVEVRESPAAPGHLKHHYMPPVPLVILSNTEYLDENTYQDLAIALNLNPLHPSFMQLPDEPTLAARELYSEMRRAAERRGDVNCLLIQYNLSLRNTGLWVSISDRLQKAARLVI